MTKREANINYYSTLPDSITEQYGELLFFMYHSLKYNKPAAGYFAKRGIKPSENYAFKSNEDRAEWITKKKLAHDKDRQEERERLAKYEVDRQKFVAGAILVSSWGWEQTNIDFYIILERKGDFVLLQEIGQQREYTGFEQGKCVPNPEEKKGQPFRKKVTKYGSVNLESYKYCGLWDGKPEHWTAYA